MGDDVNKLVADAFVLGDFPPALAETLLVLIPKEETPTQISQFRPISLWFVLFKILTKVLVNRLRPWLHTLLSPLQGSFIPGRGTTENIIIAFKLMHYIQKSRTAKDALALLIDLSKAYDRVDWRFLEKILELAFHIVSFP